MFKLTQEDSAGLAIFSLAIISPASVLSASNSSAFSYMNFIRNQETEDAARESLMKFRVQSWIFSGVLGVLAYVASQGEVLWAFGTFAVGGLVTELLYWDMVKVVDEANEKWTSKQTKLQDPIPEAYKKLYGRYPFAIPLENGVTA